MSPRRKRGQATKRSTPARAKPLDLWRPVPSLPPPAPIRPSPEPAALVHSLGPPPLQGQGTVAEHYLAAVVDASANLAVALATAAGLLAPARTDDD